jgi:polyphosphate kinase
VRDKRLKRRVLEEGLKAYLADNVEAWEMDANGRYRRRTPRAGKALSAQRLLLQSLSRPLD